MRGNCANGRGLRSKSELMVRAQQRLSSFLQQNHRFPQSSECPPKGSDHDPATKQQNANGILPQIAIELLKVLLDFFAIEEKFRCAQKLVPLLQWHKRTD